MKITLTIENENPFNAGWLAAHMGLPADCMPDLEGMDRQTFDDGYKMRTETHNTGGCQSALLAEAWDIPMPFIRHRVSIHLENKK